MRREQIVKNYQDYIAHNLKIIEFVKTIPMDKVVELTLRYWKETGNGRYGFVEGHLLGIPMCFNKKSVVVQVLTCEAVYPIMHWYDAQKKHEIKELRKAISFNYILGWKKPDDLVLYVGADVKTSLYEKYMKRGL
jgi:hypothetical protein